MNPNTKQKYKAIFGLDFMLNNKFNILFSKETIEWEGIGISIYHQREPRNKNECNKLEKETMQENKNEFMEAKDIAYLDKTKNTLTMKRKKLDIVLQEFNDLFKGRVGSYSNLEITFELKNYARLFYERPFHIPVSQLPLCKTAIQEMIDNGVLREVHEDMKWAAPTFFLPKKTPGVHTISNF